MAVAKVCVACRVPYGVISRHHVARAMLVAADRQPECCDYEPLAGEGDGEGVGNCMLC